jgi:hypothetical protein
MKRGITLHVRDQDNELTEVNLLPEEMNLSTLRAKIASELDIFCLIPLSFLPSFFLCTPKLAFKTRIPTFFISFVPSLCL